MRLVLFAVLAAAGCDRVPAPPRPPAPEPAPPGKPPARADRPDPAPPKVVPEDEPRRPDPPPPREPTFGEAVDELKVLAARMRAGGGKEYAEKKRRLEPDEVEVVERVLRRPVGPDSVLFARESDVLEGAGLSRLRTGVRLQFALADPVFERVAMSLWVRCPEMRSADGVALWAARWSGLDPVSRDAVRSIVERVEGRKELTRDEREIITAFAGTRDAYRVP